MARPGVGDVAMRRVVVVSLLELSQGARQVGLVIVRVRSSSSCWPAYSQRSVTAFSHSIRAALRVI